MLSLHKFMMPPESGRRPEGHEMIPSSNMVYVTAMTLRDVPQPPPGLFLLQSLQRWTSFCRHTLHHNYLPPKYTYPCTSIFLRTFIDIIHCLAPYPNPNHQNQTHNSDPDPKLKLILSRTLKLCARPQPGPDRMSALLKNVLTWLVECVFPCLICRLYKTHKRYEQ